MLIMRMSLRLRLTLLTGLLTGAMLLFFALVFYLFLRASLLRDIDDQLRERADLVTRSLATDESLEDQTIPLTPSSLNSCAISKWCFLA